MQIDVKQIARLTGYKRIAASLTTLTTRIEAMPGCGDFACCILIMDEKTTTTVAMGEAAGAVASLSPEKKRLPQEVDWRDASEILREKVWRNEV